MKVRNQTSWRTDHLRALIQRVAQEELDPERRRGFVVEVTYNRQRGGGGRCTGWAPYRSSMLRLMVPSDRVDSVDLAHTVAHEMAHTRGLHHRDMHTPRYGFEEGWRDYYAWADALPVERKAPRPKPTRLDRLTTKLVHALAQQRRWQTRIKVANTRLRRWRNRVRDLQKRVGVAALQSPPPGQKGDLTHGQSGT